MPIMVKKPEVPRVEIKLDFRYSMEQVYRELGDNWKELIPRPELDYIDLTLRVIRDDGNIITIVGQFRAFEASWSTSESEVIDN